MHPVDLNCCWLGVELKGWGVRVPLAIAKEVEEACLAQPKPSTSVPRLMMVNQTKPRSRVTPAKALTSQSASLDHCSSWNMPGFQRSR